MTALMPLHFATADVRMMLIDEQPWWVHNDVCAVLEISNTTNASKRLRDWQKDEVRIADPIGREQMTTIINEAGLYKLVLSSRKPVAEEFERWLTTEVLPSIRQHGCYPPPPAIDPESIPSTQVGRFMMEIARWEAQTGANFLIASGMHRNRLRFMELAGGGMVEHLNRGKLWLRVAGLGLDLHFILYGLQPAPPPFLGQRYTALLN